MNIKESREIKELIFVAINEKEMIQEKKYFSDTLQWIQNESEKIERDDQKLKGRLLELSKASRGKYSEELETAQKLYDITHKNLEKYEEAQHQPYFARIDFREYRREEETFYIGKFGLGDMESGEEKVIDWRAPIADLYYSGTFGDCYYKAPSGVISGELKLKRKFLLKDNNLTDAFDEGINEIIVKSGAEGNALVDEFLRINLEQSVSSKLKDVVATIQKEQNDIIRADKREALVVQGSAGSGKTTVALHRLAYLLYKYKESLDGDDILVIAPNKLFLDYISDVLPDLGVGSVRQNTYEDMATGILGIKEKVITKDKKLASILEKSEDENNLQVMKNSKFKGSLSYKVIMDRFIKHVEWQDAQNIQDIMVETYVLFETKEIKRLFTKDLVNLPINSRKAEIKRYLTLKLNEKIVNIMDKMDFSYEYIIARTKKTIEEGPERRKKMIELYDERDEKKKFIKGQARKDFEAYFEKWCNISTESLYISLFNDEDLFNELTDGKMPQEFYRHMRDEINENHSNGMVDGDDLAAMLYLKFKIEGVPEKHKYKHVVIDEAQDYSLFQIAAIRDMVVGDSFTIVGDIGQGIYYYKGINDWSVLERDVFKDAFKYSTLTQSYRSTVEIIEFANMVLAKQKNNLDPAMPVLRHGKKPEVIEYNNNKEFACRLDEIVDQVVEGGRKSVAIIGRTLEECRKIRDNLKKYSQNKWTLIKDTDKVINLDKIVIPSYMSKGLEFDCTVIYNCNDENYGDNELDKKVLYVALTRALHFEYVFYNGEKSKLISS